MRRRNFGKGLTAALVVGACGGAVGLEACSSSSTSEVNSGTPDSAAVPCTTSNALKIAFSPMYSAFVTDSTTHSFQVPAIVTGVSGAATWSASDPNAVSFTPDPTTGGTIINVTSAAPSVTITAQVGSMCTSTQLTVTSAVEADWQAGNARYNNGIPVYPGCIGAKVAPLLVDSGITLPPPPDAGCPDSGPACTGCHGANPTSGFFTGVQHTPEQTAGFSDQELVDIFVNGNDPDYSMTYVPYPYWHAFHTWSDISTPAQQKAMVVYLRSLTPITDEGGVNFGLLQDSGILSD